MPNSFDDTSTKTFFEETLAIPSRTVEEMKKEAVTNMESLKYFHEKEAKAMFKNFEHPPAELVEGKLVPQQPFRIPALSQIRFITAAELWRQYTAMGRTIDPDMMSLVRIEDFRVQWDALLEKKEDDPDVPKLQKNGQLIKWIEAFQIFCGAKVGSRNVPIAYLIREEKSGGEALVDMPDSLPALEDGHCHSEKHGSLESELVALVSHDHPLYRNDNQLLFKSLETALRASTLASSLVGFRRKKDGRGAWFDIISQHAGKSLWESRIKEAEDYLMRREWNGTTSLTLKDHVHKHRTSYVALGEAAEHVAHELPGNRTRVTYLIDSMKCKDPGVLAALSSVRQDDPGMRTNFELAAAFLIPTCPVAKKKTKQSLVADIAGADGGINPQLIEGKGKTGVDLRWYPSEEFQALPEAQQQELKAWRAKQRKEKKKGGGDDKKRKSGGGDGNLSKKKARRMIASLMKEHEKKASAGVATETAITDALMGFASAIQAGAPTAPAAPQAKVGATQGNPQDESYVREQARVAAGSLQKLLKEPKKGKKKSG